jgi:hypothetical protein
VSGVDAVVVAAGLGTRMGGGDKLGLLVAGRPVLAWTLAGLAAAPIVRRIVVVTAAGRVGEVSAAPWLPSRVAAVVEGGPRRQDSVAAGVGALGAGLPVKRRDVREMAIPEGRTWRREGPVAIWASRCSRTREAQAAWNLSACPAAPGWTR